MYDIIPKQLHGIRSGRQIQPIDMKKKYIQNNYIDIT